MIVPLYEIYCSINNSYNISSFMIRVLDSILEKDSIEHERSMKIFEHNTLGMKINIYRLIKNLEKIIECYCGLYVNDINNKYGPYTYSPFLDERIVRYADIKYYNNVRYNNDLGYSKNDGSKYYSSYKGYINIPKKYDFHDEIINELRQESVNRILLLKIYIIETTDKNILQADKEEYELLARQEAEEYAKKLEEEMRKKQEKQIKEEEEKRKLEEEEKRMKEKMEARKKRNEKRREELIEEKLNSGVNFFDFSGHNCNEWGYGHPDYSDDEDECPGWDGYSRRCDCGNRRVDWEYDEDYDYIYAKAY